MSIKDTLFALSETVGVGNIREASDLAYNELLKYCAAEKSDSLTVMGILKGESDYTLMLDAHIDQIAMIVTNVDENGFLTVAKSGGIDLRTLPSRRVIIHGKEKITGVFCATPPHLSSGETEYNDISKIKIDTLLGERAKEVISIGDYVTFANETTELLNGRVSGVAFDDRAAVACLIEVAKRLEKEKLPFNVGFVFSDGEELGMRGVRPATFKLDPDEAIAVDVSFGDGIGISPEECGTLGRGGMIGISPSLDMAISRKLIKIAKEKGIAYQEETMGSRTGTNADMISVSREGVRTCTLSIPLRNMHSDVEILELKDLEAVCSLICEYILSGGVMND